MIINQYYNFYTNEVSKEVADELIARMDALSALNRNVSSFGSSKQFFAVKNRQDAKPELLRRFQEWQNKRMSFAEVRAFRKVSQCCKGELIKETEQAPFIVTINYDDENGTVPGTDSKSTGEWESYGNIKYSVSNGLNKPSFYNGQPQAFLQSVTISNEGYGGIVQRVAIKMRVFTREAFEIIDQWFLRPGNEMLLNYGWSVPLTSMETATDTIHAVIFNFNATLTDDMGWIVTVYGIAKGNLAIGLALGAAADETTALNKNTGQTEIPDENVIPNLTTILKDEVNKIKRAFPGIEESDKTNIYDSSTDLDSDNRPYGVIYGSDIFPHGVGRLKFAIEKTPDETGLVPGQPGTAPSQSIIDEKNYLLAKIESVRDVSDDEIENWLNSSLRRIDSYNKIEQKYKGQNNGRRKALYEFYGQNNDFGVVNLPEIGNDSAPIVWPKPDDPQTVDLFVIGKQDGSEAFYQEFGAYAPFLSMQDPGEGGFAGSMRDAQRRQAQETQRIREKNFKIAQYRPPKGALRRKILSEVTNEGIARGTISAPSAEFLKNQKTYEEGLKAQSLIVEQQLAEAQAQQQSALPESTAINARITDAQSTARYYICLGDLVYYFNEKILKQAPELYTAVQLLVENQPTSYDPNLVSCIPMDVILSNARNNRGGMSSYGLYNSVNYGFKYKKTKENPGDLQTAFGCDGVDFFPHGEFNSAEDMDKHREDWGIYLNESDGEKVAAFNIAHIWVSVDIISQAYMEVLQGRALDPQYRTVFDFFENIFSKIAQATAGAIQLTLIPDNNQLYSNKNVDSSKLTIENSLLKKTQMFRIVDNNFQVPYNLPGAPRSFDFKVNDVNATILRDVNISLKLPSKLQTVAYTYGRAGLNEEIVDVDDSADGGSICKNDFEKLKQKQEEIVRKLTAIKDEVAYNLSTDNLEKLVNALGQYVNNPQPITSDPSDTTKAVSVHQGWIYSKLYPVELQFKLDGLSGFLYGNKVNVINALPSRYANRVFFTLVKIEHEISNNDWVTSLTAIARLKNSNGLIQLPKIIEDRPDLCDKIKETKKENLETSNNSGNSDSSVNSNDAQFSVNPTVTSTSAANIPRAGIKKIDTSQYGSFSSTTSPAIVSPIDSP